MKIKVAFTVEVDLDKWEAEYRNSDSKADIRDIVRGHAEDATREWLLAVDVMAES